MHGMLSILSFLLSEVESVDTLSVREYISLAMVISKSAAEGAMVDWIPAHSPTQLSFFSSEKRAIYDRAVD